MGVRAISEYRLDKLLRLSIKISHEPVAYRNIYVRSLREIIKR
jgi:hypothetical protein